MHLTSDYLQLSLVLMFHQRIQQLDKFVDRQPSTIPLILLRGHLRGIVMFCKRMRRDEDVIRDLDNAVLSKSVRENYEGSVLFGDSGEMGELANGVHAIHAEAQEPSKPVDIGRDMLILQQRREI